MAKEFLPAEFRFAHEYCVFLYDTLVDVLRDADAAGVFAVPYKPQTLEEGRELLSLQGEEIWDWFESKGHDEVVDEMVLKRVVPAIIADLCLFVHEALSCSRRCKLTVAYALLRKPLREDLLYLEWILVDSAKFIKAFRSGAPQTISMSSRSPEEKRDTVNRAVKLTKTTSSYPEDFIWDLRYSKEKDYGFEILWNQAVHLVTTRGSIATGPQNLNFIFSDEESFQSQWAHLYRTLPALLYYVTEIVDLVIRMLAGSAQPKWVSALEFRKLVGMRLLTSEDEPLASSLGSQGEAGEISDQLMLPCPQCESWFPFERSMWKPFFETGEVICPGCEESFSLETVFSKIEDENEAEDEGPEPAERGT